MNDIISTTEQYCHSIELAIDNAAIAAEEMVEVTNKTNNQENNTMNHVDYALIHATAHFCYCTAHAVRKVLGKCKLEARVSGNVAYALGKLPANYDIDQWKITTIYLCEAHKKMLARGKAINVDIPPTAVQMNHDEMTSLINQNPINPNQSKEDTMNTTATHIHNEDYEALDALDALRSTKKYCIDQMEGNQFTIYSMQTAGNVIIEVCTHDDCDLRNIEMIAEMRGDICCGIANCQHYTYLQCIHHTPKITNQKENTVKTIKCGYCHQTHNTINEVKACGNVTASSTPKWDREHFGTRQEAVDHQIAQKRGSVQFNKTTNKWDWFARKS